MGYVHDTSLSKIILPTECMYSAGTWTQTVASNLWTNNRTAADAAFTIQIPIVPPVQSSTALKGALLKSIDIYYVVGTLAMDAVAATIQKTAVPADGAAVGAVAAVTFTYDTGHDTAAERIDADEHSMTLTITTPFWMDDGDLVYVELVCDAAATSVFKFVGARANFTLRI
jgi:hypothetical protein